MVGYPDEPFKNYSIYLISRVLHIDTKGSEIPLYGLNCSINKAELGNHVRITHYN